MELAVTTTDVNGLYLFTGLAAGTYVVKYDYATAPTGFLPTTPASLTVSGLATGQQYLLADFGLRPPPSPVTASSIGDTVWIEERRPISRLKRWEVIRGEKKATAAS